MRGETGVGFETATLRLTRQLTVFHLRFSHRVLVSAVPPPLRWTCSRNWACGLSFSFRFPLPRPLLRLCNLGRGHLPGEIITVSWCVCISVSCRQAVPHIGFD